MEYNEKISLIFIIVSIITLLVLSPTHIILEGYINEEKQNLILRIRYLYGIIRFKINLYPKKKTNKRFKNNKNKKVKNKKGRKRKLKISINLIKEVHKSIIKVKKEEIFFYVKYGSKSYEITSLVYILLNTISSYLTSYLEIKKVYVNIIPSYVEETKKCRLKLHIKITIKDIINVLKIANIFIKDNKGVSKNERTKLNKKSNGNNN